MVGAALAVVIIGVVVTVVVLLRSQKQTNRQARELPSISSALASSGSSEGRVKQRSERPTADPAPKVSVPGSGTGLEINLTEIWQGMITDALGEDRIRRLKAEGLPPEEVADALEAWVQKNNAEEKERRRIEEPTMCQARTKKGTLCDRRKEPGSDWCWQHSIRHGWR